MIKFNNRTEETVGLDIGTYSIKVISLLKEAGENVLTAYNIKKISPDNKKIKAEEVIRETFDEIDIHPETVNLSISGPDVIVRFINLPKMNKDQLTSALSYEAEKYIPFNIDEVVLDSIILGDAPEAGQMRVLLAAAKRDHIEEKVKLLDKLGLSVNLIDADPFAIFNAFTEFNVPEKEEASAFLDLGHSYFDVLVSVGKDPCFMRQIQIGGKDFTKEVYGHLGLEPKEIELLKIPNKEQTEEEKMKTPATAVLDDLIKELQLSFGYFENRYNKSIANIYCSGGLSSQQKVVDYLGEKLGISMKKWNPAESIKLSENILREDLSTVSSQLAVSLGLALRG